MWYFYFNNFIHAIFNKETMEVLGWIFGALLIPTLIALIPFIRKVYFSGPELTIEIISTGGGSEPLGLSIKNDDSKGYIEGNNAIYHFKVTWKFNLIITNNSMVTAYYAKLYFPNEKINFSLIDKLNPLNPIKENEKLTLQAQFTMYEECKGQDRTHIKGLPPHFENLKLLLEYKNQHKKVFYTMYSLNNNVGENNFYRKRPKLFD